MDRSFRNLHLVGMRVDRIYTDTGNAGKILVLEDPDSVPSEHVDLLTTIFTPPPPAATVSISSGSLRVHVIDALELGVMDSSRSMWTLAIIGAVDERVRGDTRSSVYRRRGVVLGRDLLLPHTGATP